MLQYYGVRKVYYSIDGHIVHERVNQMVCRHLSMATRYREGILDPKRYKQQAKNKNTGRRRNPKSNICKL